MKLTKNKQLVLLCRFSVLLLFLGMFVVFGNGMPEEKHETKTIGITDLGKQIGLSDPQISPQGDRIVVQASRPNYAENRFESQLYLIDVKTGEKRPLTYERHFVRQPRWSPGGDRLAFLALDKDKKTQIFVMDMRGGEAQSITDVKQGVKTFIWSPDGKAFAFSAEDEPEKREGEETHNRSFRVGASVYLAEALEVDPTPVASIDRLKQALADAGRSTVDG